MGVGGPLCARLDGGWRLSASSCSPCCRQYARPSAVDKQTSGGNSSLSLLYAAMERLVRKLRLGRPASVVCACDDNGW